MMVGAQEVTAHANVQWAVCGSGHLRQEWQGSEHGPDRVPHVIHPYRTACAHPAAVMIPCWIIRIAAGLITLQEPSHVDLCWLHKVHYTSWLM